MKRQGSDDIQEVDTKRRAGLNKSPIPAEIKSIAGPKYHDLRSTGKPVSIKANYYRVEFPKNIHIFQYHVDFIPPLETRRLRSALLSELGLGEFIVSDHQLFLLHKFDEKFIPNVPVKNHKEGEPSGYSIHIKLAKDSPLTSNELYYCLNLHVKKLIRAKKFEQIGRSHFDMSQALERLQGGLLMVAELKHKVLRPESVYSVIRNRREEDVNNEFKDTTIFTRYNKKPYRVSYIDYRLTMSTAKFMDNKTNTEISVLDYMKQRQPQAMRQVTDYKQPIIVCELKKKVPTDNRPPTYLIPELCIVTGLTESMRKDFTLMKIFKDHTLIEPEDRLKRLDGLISSLSDPALRKLARIEQWNTQIRRDPVELTARELPYESLNMRDKRDPANNVVIGTQNGEWNIARVNGYFKSSLKGGSPIQWAILYPEDFRNLNGVKDAIKEVSDGFGINLAYPFFERAMRYSKNHRDYADELQTLPPADFVMCILPSPQKERYNAIKKMTYMVNPVVSQCVTTKVLEKDLRSVGTKLMLQILSKLGGAPWTLNFGMVKRTMIIGIDLSHNAGKISSVGMVASMNADVSSYPIILFYSRAYPHEAGKQIISGNKLGMFIKDSCLEFKARNGALPSSIIVYRDGVGESQMKAVIDAEYKQITDSLTQGAVSAEVIFIVVQKRVNARFFLMDGKRHSNVRSGTVIDTVVVARDDRHAEVGTTCDFYLVSQSHMQGRNPAQGTMNPTRYWVRHPHINEPTATSIDTIQSLTYKLCHVYYNWPGTISVPALCKYAKVLAIMAGQVLEGPSKEALYGKLYYI